MESSEAPRIAAVFEVIFDQKVGYVISWKRTLPGVELDGVEFKSLPSGSHDVKNDLVYFVHGAYAGVSAFVQEEADEQHRNAHFVAIGALIPLTYGRLGKSWTHAAELRDLARERVKNNNDTRALELFWKKHQQDETIARDEMASPSVVRKMSLPANPSRPRRRSRSDTSATFSSSDGYPPDHPALSMPNLLDTFGPLIFPLYRAALLRKRILLLGTSPVQESCNFVYVLSILSSIPQTLIDIIEPDTQAPLRTQALFSVGVHDIPFLTDRKRKQRWLACTTDDILGEKKQIYDILVRLPHHSASAGPKQWPEIVTSSGEHLKATQRDLRRYRLLRSELKRTTDSAQRYRDNEDDSGHDDDDMIRPLMRASTTALLNEVKHTTPGESLVCEPVSWTAMAYNGFMWWASAGEMEAWANEEARADRELLDEVPDTEDLLRHLSQDASNEGAQLKIAEATMLTAYFHRLTAGILQPLADLVEDADDDTEEGIADQAIVVSSEDVRAMGLDTWSQADKEFVGEAMELYFVRDAKVEESAVRICGVKMC